MYRQAEEEEKKINFQKMCEETSLHGWKFIYFKNSQPCHAAFWIMVILSVIALSGIIIRDYVIGNVLVAWFIRRAKAFNYKIYKCSFKLYYM